VVADFKGDPDKLMERYFDAHVYVANWMTAIAGGQGAAGRTVRIMAARPTDGRYRRTPAYAGRIAAERRKGPTNSAGKTKTGPKATGDQ